MSLELQFSNALPRMKFLLSLHPASMGEIAEDEMDDFLRDYYRTKGGSLPRLKDKSVRAKQRMLWEAREQVAQGIAARAEAEFQAFNERQARDESLETRLQREADKNT